MTAVLVVPPDGHARIEQLPAGDAERLAKVQQLVEGYVQQVLIHPPGVEPLAVLVNEEGLILALQQNRPATKLAAVLGWAGDAYVGTVLFAGLGDEDWIDVPDGLVQVAGHLGIDVTPMPA